MRGFHCDNSSHVYSVPWTCSPPPLYFHSHPLFSRPFPMWVGFIMPPPYVYMWHASVLLIPHYAFSPLPPAPLDGPLIYLHVPLLLLLLFYFRFHKWARMCGIWLFELGLSCLACWSKYTGGVFFLFYFWGLFLWFWRLNSGPLTHNALPQEPLHQHEAVLFYFYF
jgi:hypothetical protein